MSLFWSVVVPAKPPALGKSRLRAADDGRLAAAMLSDTLHAVVAAASVSRLIVVTSSAQVETLMASIAPAGAEVAVLPDPGGGLNAAIAAGLRQQESGPWAVLLGDLPALTPAELDRALALAEAVPLGVVPDAEGSGTVLLTGRDARPVPQFGVGSAARHVAAGHAVLDMPTASGLRRDVDTPADLDAAVELGVGPATRAVLTSSR